ncbi:MAG: PqqD family protein [Bacilli bacterium]|nr:PqqD family protein [Bacilli bacterium]
MKLKQQFITRMVGDTQMMVDSSANKDKFNGIVKSNATASFIIDLLKEEKSEQDLVEALLNAYEVDADTALKAVRYVIEKLNSINALE